MNVFETMKDNYLFMGLFIFIGLFFSSHTFSQFKIPQIIHTQGIEKITIIESKDGEIQDTVKVFFSKENKIKALVYSNYQLEYQYVAEGQVAVKTKHLNTQYPERSFDSYATYKQIDSAHVEVSTIFYRADNSIDTVVQFYGTSILDEIPYVSAHFNLSNEDLKAYYGMNDLYALIIEDDGILKQASFKEEQVVSGCIIYEPQVTQRFVFNYFGLLSSVETTKFGEVLSKKAIFYNPSNLPAAWIITDKQGVVYDAKVLYTYFK